MLWKRSVAKSRLQWLDSAAQVDRDRWNALAQPLATPFLEWEWLVNLERSGCAVPAEGWLPRHLTLWEDDTLVAIAPLYLKGHSYGEFVFDHQWADLAYRLGINYYPKLLGMTPFTPATGYRFLIHPDITDPLPLVDELLAEIDRFCRQHRISGCHFLFVEPTWKGIFAERDFLVWQHHSYIWQNQNFRTFDDYLQSFNANQRKNIKKERRTVANANVVMRVYAGEEVSERLLDIMYRLYSDHCDKYWGSSKYLNHRFFRQLAHNYRDRLVLVAGEAQDTGDPIGMSFCIRKGDRLYGRYWGCFREIDCLHFDTCYYTPIAWAIEQGIQMFDPGAGGEHKKRRGFPATPNYSLHRIYAPRLRQILIPHLQDVNAYSDRQIEAINRELPFSQAEPTLAGLGGSG